MAGTKTLDIIRTSDKTFVVSLIKKDPCGDCGEPLDITGATEITVCLPAEAGGSVMATLTGTEVSILNAILGKIQVTFDDTKTALLTIGEEQDIEVQIEIGADKTIVQIIECLNVVDTIC